MSREWLQPAWKNGIGTQQKPHQITTNPKPQCERATVGNSNSHSCDATVAVLLAHSASFRPLFGLLNASKIFKQLTLNDLKAPPKFAYFHPEAYSMSIAQAQGPKSCSLFDKIGDSRQGRTKGRPGSTFHYSTFRTAAFTSRLLGPIITSKSPGSSTSRRSLL